MIYRKVGNFELRDVSMQIVVKIMGWNEVFQGNLCDENRGELKIEFLRN